MLQIIIIKFNWFGYLVQMLGNITTMKKPTIKHKANIIFQWLHNTKTKQKILLNSIALK